MNSLPEYDVIYFDGTCGLCHWFVKLLLHLDPDGRYFRFAHGDPGASSVIVQTSDGRRFIRSDAAIYALSRVHPAWSALKIIPRRSRDWMYAHIARNRLSLVRKCPIMPPEFRKRLLPPSP